MLEFDEALRRMLCAANRLGEERVALSEAHGRVLARSVFSRKALPEFDYSAMDGYAVHSRQLAPDGPYTLPVRGESRAGQAAPKLEPRTACRIFTGAPLPEGADSVIMQEDVELDAGSARFTHRPEPGQNVRRAGEDIRPGQVALETGLRLAPRHLALCAALDCIELVVGRHPIVAIACTGDELRAPGQPASAGSVVECNAIAIAAMAERAGAKSHLLPFIRDDAEETLTAFKDALRGTDLLITIGGVSVGEHDLVRPALEAAGAELDFWKVRIKPGKPLVFGRAGHALILGLPGNPVSAQVTFGLFGMPLLRTLQGDSKAMPRFRRLRLGAPVRQRPGRRGFYRARIEGDVVLPLDNQASGAVTSMAWAEALISIDADSEGSAAGETVEVLLVDEL